MDNFDLRKYLAEGSLLKEDIKDKAISVLNNYEGEVEGVEGYIKYLMNTSDDISSSIQAIADDLDRDKPSSDSLRRDLEKLSLAEGSLLKEDGLSKLLLKVLKAYQPEVEQQLGTKLANWKLDDMDDASATDVDELTGFSFKIASEFDDRFKGGGFGDDDTDPEIIDLANKKIAVIKYNL
jgi:hypothetical protein